MSEIPKEIKEKIENYINENIGIVFSDGDQDLKDANKIAISETKEAIEYGYQLATDGREELEKEKDRRIKDLEESEKFLDQKGYDIEAKYLKQIETLKARVIELEGGLSGIINSCNYKDEILFKHNEEFDFDYWSPAGVMIDTEPFYKAKQLLKQ